jgi:hypothetical protein
MIKRIMIKPAKLIRGKKKKINVVAVTVTALLSATAAFAAIKAARKASKANGDLKKEPKSEFEIVLDGLVEDGTITQAQQVAIQSAITTAKEASTANGDLKSEDNGEFITVLEPSKTNTLTRLKKSLFNVELEPEKKPAQEMTV